MELWTGAFSSWKFHGPDLKNTGHFRRNLFLNSLKPQHSIPCWVSVQWKASAFTSCQCYQKRVYQMFAGGFALSGPLGYGRAIMLPLGTLSLGHSSRSYSLQFTRASRTAGYELISSTISLLSCQRLSFWSSLSTIGINLVQIFCFFSSSYIIVCTVPTLTFNCALIVSIDTRRSLSMKFFIWAINSSVLTYLLLPHLSSSLTDSLPSLNLYAT